VSTDATAPVLLYDGVCGVCNRGVRTILRFDRRGTLRFAALDSDFARGVIARHPELADVDSVVYVTDPGGSDETVDVQSAAMLRVAEYLGGPWRVTLAARAIPPGLRDWAYAGIRYRIGGRYDTCPIPPPEVRSRFIDAA
jgi:predicted DCC family thiol-disulfide oxidoreductase YuxK